MRGERLTWARFLGEWGVYMGGGGGGLWYNTGPKKILNELHWIIYPILDALTVHENP